MPDGLNFSVDTTPIFALLRLASAASELTSRLATLRLQQAKAEKAVLEYSGELNSVYEDVSRSGHTADWILEAATIARRRELTERERFGAQLSALRQKLRECPYSEDSEARRLLEKSITTGEAWIELPAQLHKKLLALADERRASAARVRPARPIQGEMQNVELTRKIIGRFPNILAELAK